jgi:hypothetical protein
LFSLFNGVLCDRSIVSSRALFDIENENENQNDLQHVPLSRRAATYAI